LELLSLSAVIGLFTGLVILLVSREWWLAAIGFGVAVILAIMMIALLALSAKPNAEELSDLDEQNRGAH
jgi:ABC-type bacteriocin/lantibiotic exporter with double-glycine peptidase domain